jgi:predicted RNA-binding Zn-ribbon protein involved in translation (DUF1610 family)
METVQKSTESLSKSQGGGAAIGAGAVLLPQMFQQQPQAQQPMVICPKCGFQNPQTSKFCNNCGTTMQPAAQAQAAAVKCPKCGTENPTTAKFCVNCGNAMQTTVKCPKCATEVPAGTKFCPNCGAKMK